MPVTDLDVMQTAHLVSTGQRAYLDVRTKEEFEGGHVPGAINVPFLNKGPDGMTENENFVEEVKAKFTNPAEDRIAVGCQLGGRSARAAKALEEANYQFLVNVTGGFKDWEANKLPVKNPKCWMGPKNV